MSSQVAIVYLCHNNRSYLPDVFDAFTRLNYPKDKLEIIVVDNASTDGSVEWLRARREITFLPSGENLGFAQGNNLGIHRALLQGFDYVYLLNGDAKLHPDAIKEAVRVAQADASVGAVQSRLMLWRRPEMVNATGGMVHFLGFGFVQDNGRPWEDIVSAHTDGEEIAYASGAAVLYRASVLREVGLLDPFLFMYHEDLDLGWRIRLAGYKNVLAIDSIAYHDYEFKRSIKKFYWMERNRILVHASHLRLLNFLLLLPFLFIVELGLIPFAIKGGWLKEHVLVWVEFLRPRVWKYLTHKRHESRWLRRVSDREIVRLWTGRIEHQEAASPVVDHVINPLLAFLWCIILKRCIR